MAGDWIKMRTALCTDARVDEIASILNENSQFRRSLCCGEGDPGPLRTTMLRHLVVGALHAFWTRMQEITVDGDVPTVSPETVDACLDLPGLMSALVHVGWLKELEGGGIRVPNWNTHNSESAKKRALEAQKKRLQRDKGVPKVSPKRGDRTGTREEKRREEKRERREDSPSHGGKREGECEREGGKDATALRPHSDSAVSTEAQPAEGPPEPLRSSLTALDKWAMTDRGHPLDRARGEASRLAAFLEELEGSPPVLRGQESLPVAGLVPLAVQVITGQAKPPPFKSVAFALGCVRTQLQEWQAKGMGEVPETAEQRWERMRKAGVVSGPRPGNNGKEAGHGVAET